MELQPACGRTGGRVVRIAGTETETETETETDRMRAWLKEWPGGLEEVVGRDVYTRAFV